MLLRVVTRKLIPLALTCAIIYAPFTNAQNTGLKNYSPSAAAAAIKLADNITGAQLKNYLEFIAADEMEGRETPSRGLNLTAKFLAFNLAQWGVRPGGDGGSYFQRILLRRTRIDGTETRVALNEKTFGFGEDFLVNTLADNVVTNAPLVFVGHGWIVKAKNINAYDGVDVKDKIMVVSAGGFPPKEAGGSFPLPGEEGKDWEHPYAYALSHGAKGLIIIPGYPALTRWKNSFGKQTAGIVSVEKFETSEPARILYESTLNQRATIGLPIPKENRLPVITVSPQTATEIFSGEKLNAAAIFQQTTGAAIPPFDLSGNKRLSLTVRTISQTETTQNVVAIVEGSDPVLKNEYVALGAHYDHLGTGADVGGDAIYNGADDDGSGTVAVLAIARAFAGGNNARPKRSILFVWHCAEEKGLWGSRYFTELPTVPIDKITAQLNIDMIGRSRPADDNDPADKDLSEPDEIYVIGSKMMSSELGDLCERVNKNFLNLKFNYKYDDPEDSQRLFYRSDHYNYAAKGVPIIFYTTGLHGDYHKPSDSIEKIDFQKMEKVSRTVLMTALEIANGAKRPVVNKPLPEN